MELVTIRIARVFSSSSIALARSLRQGIFTTAKEKDKKYEGSNILYIFQVKPTMMYNDSKYILKANIYSVSLIVLQSKI
jgi:hypothetical protein